MLANYQDDDLENQSTGFLPIYGTMLPNPLGKVPVGRNLGETGYNFFKREQWSAGYDFSHHFNDRVSIQQNLKYFDVKVDSHAVFGTGLLDADFDGVPDDYRTVIRSIFPFNERIDSLSVDTRVLLRPPQAAASSSRCWSASTTATTTASPSSALASARRRRIDLFEPVYDAVIPPADDISVHRRDSRADRDLPPGPAQVRPLHPDAERTQRLGRSQSGGWHEPG